MAAPRRRADAAAAADLTLPSAVIICARSHMRRCRKRPQSNCLSSSCASANAPRWGSYAGFAGGLSCRCRWQLGRSVAALPASCAGSQAGPQCLGECLLAALPYAIWVDPCDHSVRGLLGMLWRVVPPSPCAGSRRSPRQTHDCVGVVQVSAPLSRCPWLNLAPEHRRWRGVR